MNAEVDVGKYGFAWGREGVGRELLEEDGGERRREKERDGLGMLWLGGRQGGSRLIRGTEFRKEASRLTSVEQLERVWSNSSTSGKPPKSSQEERVRLRVLCLPLELLLSLELGRRKDRTQIPEAE